MKVKKCLNKGVRIIGIKLRKATSYKNVKGRLGYRWFSDEQLQAHLDYLNEKDKVNG